MIKACHHWFYDTFFNFYIHRILKKDFHAINIFGEWDVPDESSNLVIGNHVSWWDGFWVYCLNKRFLKKRFHVMMLQEQLNDRKFLRRIGAFSIYPGTRSVLESLNYTVEKLKEPGNIVLMYPQGKIASFSAGVLPFQPGVEHVIKKSGVEKVLFYAAFVDFFEQRKPTLNIYLSDISTNKDKPLQVEDQFRDFYEDSLKKQVDFFRG
ncbi:lysophospholipid acyltransferase family protein [Marinilabiliaceae bacterium ANBcel2]|nr:lysophospholipid acyltransferase family protein [Marinilabiliaceae bacterium ANBcel2]